jgi:hypothetical protein
MAKKTDLLPGEPTPEPEPAPAPKPKEKLLSVAPMQWFSDGNLQDFMAAYGYPCEWPAGQVRHLPAWLIRRCINSGAEFERATE